MLKWNGLNVFRFSRLYLLASERSERDTLRSVQLKIGDIPVYTSTECKTLKGERRMIFIFNIITALNQDRGIFCPCGKDALSLPVLIK